MAAINLNTVRSTIENRLNDEFRKGPVIPLVLIMLLLMLQL